MLLPDINLCSCLFYVAVINNMTKANCGEEGLFYLIGYGSLLREVRKGTQGQDSQRKEKQSHGGKFFLALFQDSCSAPFPMESKPTSLGIELLIVGWALQYQLEIKEVSHRVVYWQIWYRKSLNWGSLFSSVSTWREIRSSLFTWAKFGITERLRPDSGIM